MASNCSSDPFLWIFSTTFGRRGAWLAVLLTGMLLARDANAQISEAQATPGRPFGIGAVTFQVPPGRPVESHEFFLEEKNNRALYPVFSAGAVSRVLGQVLGTQTNSSTRTVLFLFTGSEPLDLTIHTPKPVSIQLRAVAQQQRNVDRLVTRWWREYSSASSALASRGDYPPIIETYLTGMLGQRLGLRPPLLTRITQGNDSPIQRTMNLLLVTEEMHTATMRQTMATARSQLPADQPVPRDIAWIAPNVPPIEAVEVEPIAMHVPQECFYVRFGSFENYLWLEDLMTSQGGDIGRMVTARGQDAKQGDRMRRQLALPFSALAKLFGGTLIEDVALIGRDLYLEDGAAVGVLFKAKNTGALGVSLRQQRSTALAAEEAIRPTTETITIAGHEVSAITTPDNVIRSFYAVDGDFHLITTSRAIVERFFAAGRGEGSLGGSPEFQHARSLMPTSRGDTIFAFLSSSFFSGLLAPHYQIELGRRLQAITDIELIQLAELAAKAEGVRADDVDGLIAAGFLPQGFGQGVDGSGPIVEESRVIDSLRGARGTFLPIPDVELTGATQEEVIQYSERAAYFSQNWQQFDPLMVALKRTKLPGSDLERLTVDANISPLAEQKYGWIMSLLGPPVVQQVAPREGDVISMQAYVTGGQKTNLIPPHLLFLGIQDMQPDLDVSPTGMMQVLRILRSTPGYLGAWPKPGFLDWLPLRAAPPGPDGYSKLLFDVWRWQGGAFSVVSFHRDVLDLAVPQLRVEETDSPAQIRVHVGDLSQSRLRDWVNWMYYGRARQTSLANVQLMEAVVQQLRVPPKDARATCERVLGTNLVCALGGEYELTTRDGREVWHSTAWNEDVNTAVPAKYEAPLMQWFRGMRLDLTKAGDRLVMHSEVDMKPGEVPAAAAAPGLPLFDFFKKKDGEKK